MPTDPDRARRMFQRGVRRPPPVDRSFGQVCGCHAVEARVPGVAEDAKAACGPFARPVLTLRQIADLPPDGRLGLAGAARLSAAA